MKNLTLNGSLLINGKPQIKKNSLPMQPSMMKKDQMRPSVVHVRPKSGVSSEHVMQVCDCSLTNLIHTVANMTWLVSSTQGLAATISGYKIEPPNELLSLTSSTALSEIIGMVSSTSDTFLESALSYLAEMLVELSVGCKNDHIYRLFLFGRSKTIGTSFMKVHTHTRKLAIKLEAYISANNFSNLQFTATIVFRMNSPSSDELQRSKNQMEGIADIARKGVPVSKLPPFDVSSSIEFNLRREVHDLVGHVMPESLLQHMKLHSESNTSVPLKNPVADSNDAAPLDRVTDLETKLGASLLREHELRVKVHAMDTNLSVGKMQHHSFGSIPKHGAETTGIPTSIQEANIRYLQIELQEAAKREEALKTAPYFGTNPASSFDIAQLKAKLQDITDQLAQRDSAIVELQGRLAGHQDHISHSAGNAAFEDASSHDTVVESMQRTIVDLRHQLSALKPEIERLKSELKISSERENKSTMASKQKESLSNVCDTNFDNSEREHISSLESSLKVQMEINLSLTTAAATHDKQLRDLDMQVSRLQAKLQESYDEVDDLTSEQTHSKFHERIAELETEIEQAALREENLQQMMASWSTEDDRRRLRDLELELILTKRREEDLRNAPPPPIPPELIEKIRSLEETLKKSGEDAQSLKRKLESTVTDAKDRSEKWASTEAELRSACLQWSPEVDRKRILELDRLVQSAKEREEALNGLLQQKPTRSMDDEREMQRMKILLQEQQSKIALLEDTCSSAPSKDQLLEGQLKIQQQNTRMESLEQREVVLQQTIDTLHTEISEKNSEIEQCFQTLEMQTNTSKSREEYLMFEISQLKERLPENRDEVIEGLKLVTADSIGKTRSQKAEIQELHNIRVDLELQRKMTMEAEAKIKLLMTKLKEQKKLLENEKAANLELETHITELKLTIEQSIKQASLQGLTPKEKDHKVEAFMLNSKRTIVGLDKERRVVHEKEKETAKRNQELKVQASQAQERMQRAVESEEEMQIRLKLLSEVTSNEAKIASTIVDSLSVASEQRLLALESERDACKLQEQTVLKQLEEMEEKVVKFEQTKLAAQANEATLAIEVAKLRKLVQHAHTANSLGADSLQDFGKIELPCSEVDTDAILQTTTVQEYLQTEITRAQDELRDVLEREFVATLAEFEIRKGDAVHTAFIKADATVVQRIQNFVDEKAEIMKHMTHLTRAHADSNMAAKLADEKLMKMEPVASRQNLINPVSKLKIKPNSTSTALPPIKMADINVSTADSFPRRLLSIGTSPLPGARSEDAGAGVGFVAEEMLSQNVSNSPYAQSSIEPSVLIDASGTKDDFTDTNLSRSATETRNILFEEQLISEKKKFSKIMASMKALQEEKVALQVELATQRHLTDVCQQELEFLRKQTKKGFLPRFLDKSPTRNERAEKDLEIQDDVDDNFRRSDFRHSRSASGPVQFAVERGSSQKFAGVSINTMKKLNDDDLQRIKAYSPNLFKTEKKKPMKQADASELFKSEFNYPKSKFEQLADQWMFDEPSIKKRQEQMMLQEHLQSLKSKALKQQAVLFAVASKQGVRVPQ